MKNSNKLLIQLDCHTYDYDDEIRVAGLWIKPGSIIHWTGPLIRRDIYKRNVYSRWRIPGRTCVRWSDDVGQGIRELLGISNWGNSAKNRDIWSSLLITQSTKSSETISILTSSLSRDNISCRNFSIILRLGISESRILRTNSLLSTVLQISKNSANFLLISSYWFCSKKRRIYFRFWFLDSINSLHPKGIFPIVYVSLLLHRLAANLNWTASQIARLRPADLYKLTFWAFLAAAFRTWFSFRFLEVDQTHWNRHLTGNRYWLRFLVAAPAMYAVA